MASYHLTVKAGQKGKAAAHAAYIAREGKYSDGKRYEDLEAKAIGNMPAWAAHNPEYFWAASDENERANGTAYREIEIALPREFTPTQRLELLQEFIRQELADKHAYQYAIHTNKAALEKNDQPHAHIMYSERILDGIERDPQQYFKRYNSKNPEKGGNKKASGGKLEEERKAELIALREKWAELQNKHLEKNGHISRVDHRSLKAQGIDREPEKHLGGAGVRKTSKTDTKALLELRAANAENAQAKAEVINLLEHKKNKAETTEEQREEVRALAAASMEKFKQRMAERTAAEETAAKAYNEKLRKEQELKRAEQTLLKLMNQERDKWRQSEHEKLLKEAEEKRLESWKLHAQEPKMPLGLFATGKYKTEFAHWKRGVQQKIDECQELRKQAQDALEGKSPKEDGQTKDFALKGTIRLKNEHPEIFKAIQQHKRNEENLAKANAFRKDPMGAAKNYADLVGSTALLLTMEDNYRQRGGDEEKLKEAMNIVKEKLAQEIERDNFVTAKTVTIQEKNLPKDKDWEL